MNGRRTKELRRLCRRLWDALPRLKLAYGVNNFSKFFDAAKRDVVAGKKGGLAALVSEAAAAEEAAGGKEPV